MPMQAKYKLFRNFEYREFEEVFFYLFHPDFNIYVNTFWFQKETLIQVAPPPGPPTPLLGCGVLKTNWDEH